MTEELTQLKNEIQHCFYKDFESAIKLRHTIYNTILVLKQQYKPAKETTALASVIRLFQDALETWDRRKKYHKDVNKRITLEKEAFKAVKDEALDSFSFLGTSIRLGTLVRNTSG